MSKLSQWKNRGKSQAIPKLDSLARKQLSAGQSRLFFLQEMYGKSTFYQYAHLYTFSLPLNEKEIEEKLTCLINKHSILRSNYVLTDGNIEVNIRAPFPFELDKSEDSLHAFYSKTFKLDEDILIRAKIFDGNQLAVSMHHIIADRESLMLMQKELFDSYELEVPKIDFFDFAHWYNSKIDKEEDLAYWQNKLSDSKSILNLPFDFQRSSQPLYAGKTLEKEVSNQFLKKAKKVCTEHKVTLYVLMLAGFKVLLSKYSSQEDILVGTPVSNRDRKEVESLVGFFNETLVLRSFLDGKKSFASFLQEVKREFLESLAHKNVSFSALVKAVNPERIPGVNPIFQSMFLYNRSDKLLEYKGGKVEDQVIDLGVSKFDLTLFVHEGPQKLNLRLEYSTELFKEETAIKIFDEYARLLERLLDEIDIPVDHIEVEQESDKPSILDLHEIKQQNSVLDLIPISVDSIAVKYDKQEISYFDLDQKSRQLAGMLLTRGVSKNDFVGLYTERSIEMIIGILAIMKAGGAYLPLDPEYPKERIQYMIEDSGCKLILSHGKHLLDDDNYIDINGSFEHLDAEQLPNIEADQLAYAIYTSGSSGKPKGVQITHSNLLYSTSSRFEYYKEDVGVFMLLSSFSFDSSVAGIFWTLTTGGQLLLPPPKIEQDIERFAACIEENEVSHTLMLPSLYELLLDYSEPSRLSSLRTIMVAGEACSPKVVEKHFTAKLEARLYNEYGPTEATVWCIAHELKVNEEDVAIGKAIPYYDVYILDKNLMLTPSLVIGELYVGGPGLSPGYLNRPELTQEKFIQHERFGRLYKTGDLAKKNANGDILFLGRADSQIKIRGHRVELDEIKKRILERSTSSEAEVIFVNNRIIAYTDKAIEKHLGLPDYMTPSQFIVLEEFPKLPNGKTNLRGLPSPEEVVNPHSYVEARTESEVKLLEIWKEILQIDKIGIDDNFFSLGGDSLLSIKMLALSKKKGLSITASKLFEHQTIRKLGTFLEGRQDNPESQVLVPLKKSGDGSPLFCIHGGGAHVFFYKAFAESLPENIPVYSFQAQSLDGKSQMAANIEEMSATYIGEMRKIQANGPYNILGTCFSNAVALEMANQLKNQGEEVNNLFIIDSAPVHLFGNTDDSEKQTLRRFLDMLKRGDYIRISSKISRRIFGAKKWNSPIKDASETDEVLKETIFALNKMYADYDWKPFDGKIKFIRSTEFNARKDKKYHLSQWNKLAKKGLEISVVEGHHLTLFEEPEVEGLATEVAKLLSQE